MPSGISAFTGSTQEHVAAAAHLVEVAMLKQAHVGAQAVVSRRQLGLQLWRQLVQLQSPFAQRKPAVHAQRIRPAVQSMLICHARAASDLDDFRVFMSSWF